MEILEFKNEGIYLIYNQVNNDCYIGHSMNVGNRKTKHISLLSNNKHSNELLQNAVNQYGIENFKIGVLEYTTENLLEKEQKYVDILKPKYNITKDVINNTPSLESRRKMSKTRLKMYEKGLKPNGAKPIIQTDLNGNFIKEFRSVRQASIQLKIDKSAIHRVLCGKYKQMKSFIFLYKKVL